MSWKCVFDNGVDLCVNEGQRLNEYRVSLAEGKKKKKGFLTVSGRWPFWKVLVCIWVVFHT